MRRGVFICTLLVALCILSTQVVFGISSVGGEKNLNSSTVQLASEQSNNCLLFETVQEQIQCRLTSQHLLPSQSFFCAETQRNAWCEVLIENAIKCLDETGTTKDKCFVSRANLHTSIEYTAEESYILFLLLDLINDAQLQFEKGELSLDATTDLISQLTNISHAVMRHEPQSVLSILFAQYARSYENYSNA